MRKLPYLLTVAAISGLALSAIPSSASPLASGLMGANAVVPEIGEGMVQKVHGWHCSRKWSKRLGKHSHRRACYERRRYYDDDYYDDYSYGYGYPSYGYGYGVPFFFGFNFDDSDGRRGHRGHRGRRGDDD